MSKMLAVGDGFWVPGSAVLRSTTERVVWVTEACDTDEFDVRGAEVDGVKVGSRGGGVGGTEVGDAVVDGPEGGGWVVEDSDVEVGDREGVVGVPGPTERGRRR